MATPYKNLSPNRVSSTARKTAGAPSDRTQVTRLKRDSGTQSVNRSLRRKVAQGTTGQLQEKYLQKATDFIPNPIARGAAKFAIKNAKKVETTSINVEVFSWATPFWLAFQLPLAVLSLVLAGATYFLHDYLPEQARQSGLIGNAIYSAITWVGSIFAYAAEQILGLTVDPASMFLALNTIVFFLGFGVLIIMTLQYTFAGISPFLGKGAVFKVPAFIFAVFFYMVPFFNIFPWFMLWAFAVNLNPE